MFDKIDAFKGIPQLPMDSVLTAIQKISNLKEKCKNGAKNEDCANCLRLRNKEEYKTCIKYILGHFLGRTGGTHDGHEVCDIGLRQKIANHEGCFVCYIIKPYLSSNKDTSGKARSKYFEQFHDRSHDQGINVVTTVTITEMDNKLESRINTAIHENQQKKYYCFITDREFSRIFCEFERMQNEI